MCPLLFLFIFWGVKTEKGPLHFAQITIGSSTQFLPHFSFLLAPQTHLRKMEHNSVNKAEAERLLGIAEKLLHNRDLNGSREFAILAQETEPLLEGSDQILAIVDVLLAAEKKINNNHHDWYAVLQLEKTIDSDAIRKQYRKLALLLHPDKNKFPFADQAFKLVADAWAVLSDANRKTGFDKEFGVFTKVDLGSGSKFPVRRGRPPGSKNKQTGGKKENTPRQQPQAAPAPAPHPPAPKMTNFWTMCPYCYNLYQYQRVYEGCCLRCENCQRAFEAVMLPSLPPLVPGKEAYYCTWGYFPMGYTTGDVGGGKGGNAAPAGFPNWMPPVFAQPQQGGKNVNAEAAAPQQEFTPGQQRSSRNGETGNRAEGRAPVVDISDGSPAKEYRPTPAKKRGRPRKYPLQG